MARAALQFDDNKIMVKKQWCKGCGICIVLCNNKVLAMDGRGRAVVANPAACTGCGKCEAHCPDLAITVNRMAGDKVSAADAGSVFPEKDAATVREPAML